MSEHHARLTWEKGGAPFTYDAYTRNHRVSFKDGAVALSVSASPAFLGDATHPDPEDLMVAALSSCHMLSFLAIAARKRLTVLSYEDDAVGHLEKQGGKFWLTRVELRPKVRFEADIDPALLAEIHHKAHEECFIANSVKTEINVQPR
jgi:organic hydroperoxide reductase OsmC/OhrA